MPLNGPHCMTVGAYELALRHFAENEHSLTGRLHRASRRKDEMPRETTNASSIAAVGPYSHAAGHGGLIFLSGQTPLDPATGELVEGSVGAQTEQVFANLRAVVDAAGLSLADVVKVNVFLTSMDDFAAMNAVYAEQFDEPFPARTTIGVAALPLGARVEIEMIAAAPAAPQEAP